MVSLTHTRSLAHLLTRGVRARSCKPASLLRCVLAYIALRFLSSFGCFKDLLQIFVSAHTLITCSRVAYCIQLAYNAPPTVYTPVSLVKSGALVLARCVPCIVGYGSGS
jgi:hypothetical protein